MRKLKLIGIIILILALLLFTIQNRDPVEIDILTLWSFEAPLILVLLLTLLLGTALGIFLARNVGKDKPAKATTNPQGQPAAQPGSQPADTK